MPTINFRTVAGSAVASRGSVTRNPAWGGGGEPSGEGTLTLTANRSVGTAPAGFLFSVAAAGFDDSRDDFDPYFDVRYKWTFDDIGYYTRHDTDDLPWDRYYDVDGNHRIVRGPNVYNTSGTYIEAATHVVGTGYTPTAGSSKTFLGHDKNLAYGPRVAHVFDTPGTYTVTCEARVLGQAPVTETIQIVVEDVGSPGVTWTWDSICISSSLSSTGAPAGAQIVANYAAAVSAASGKGENLEILFNRGEAHTTNFADGQPQRSGGFRRLRYSVYGSGAEPTAGPGALIAKTNRPADSECMFSGFKRSANYDPTDPANTTIDVDVGIKWDDAAYTTLWDLEIYGQRVPIRFGSSTRNMVVGNTYVHDWHNYGLYGEQGAGIFGMCGVWIKQNPYAVLGNDGRKGESTPPYYQDHAPNRFSSLGDILALNLVDFRSVGGHSGAHQPSLRIGRSVIDASNPFVEEAVFDRMRTEVGRGAGQGADKYQYPRRYLFDKVYCVEINQSGSDSAMINTMVTGPHHRNIIVTMPDTPRVGGGQLRRFTRMKNPDGATTIDPAINDFKWYLYNFTFVDFRAPPETIALQYTAPNDTFATEETFAPTNGVYFAAHPSRADYDLSANLDMTSLWTPQFPGQKIATGAFDTDFAFSPSDAPLLRPNVGSPAIGSAISGRVSVDDFFGNLRDPESLDTGAVAYTVQQKF